MKISEAQLQLMFIVLTDSIKVDISRIFTLTYEARESLWKNILEQQSDKIREIIDE